MNKYWFLVVIAALFEIGWVIGLAHAYNFLTWLGTIIAIVESNYLLIKSANFLPAGTAYAVFVGIGTAGAVIIEILFFGEPFQPLKILLIILLLIGVIGLQQVTNDIEKNEVES